MTRRTRHGLLLAALCSCGAVATVAVAAFVLGTWWTAPARRHIGPPPGDLAAENVSFPSAGNVLHGWFVPGRAGGGGVVLLHGVRESRRRMIGRARFLNHAGYAVLLFDLQAHGESDGAGVRFGRGEAADAAAAVSFLRERVPGERIGALGFSLGGAACLLGPTPLAVDALVLEGVYAEVETAVANRLRVYLGPAGSWLTPLLAIQLEPRWGIAPRDLRPIDAIKNVHVPLLIIAGSEDQRTTLADSERLFAAAPEPKELWVVPGAGHVDFHHFARAEYEARVGQFFARYLRLER